MSVCQKLGVIFESKVVQNAQKSTFISDIFPSCVKALASSLCILSTCYIFAVYIVGIRFSQKYVTYRSPFKKCLLKFFLCIIVQPLLMLIRGWPQNLSSFGLTILFSFFYVPKQNPNSIHEKNQTP